MRYLVNNARLVDSSGEHDNRALIVDGQQIESVDPTDAEGLAEINAAGLIVTPGFVDVHTHGGGGFNLHTPNPDEIRSFSRWAPSTGTTSYLVGVVGVPGGLPAEQIGAAVQAIKIPGKVGAEALGIHLEGPYMSPERRGAHDPSWLRTPSAAETSELLDLVQGTLRLITLAPELAEAHALVRELVAAGVTVSLGHSDATYEQSRQAIQLGITHATHCFNAMRPLHHREPGPLGAIVEAPTVRGELIADGVHVHPAALRVLIRALGPERTIIVTDALACAGVQNATFTFAGQTAQVIDGVARLADGTITGSVLTMDQALRNLVTLLELPLHQAVGMLTVNPAYSAGSAHRKGRLAAGYDADLLLFDQDLRLQATICRGALAWSAEEIRPRLAPLLADERPKPDAA
ncbi:MAG TPA: N-acetylglucosamine-6-phosphate deacetylase [Herpetosiphonaceae bacterium]